MGLDGTAFGLNSALLPAPLAPRSNPCLRKETDSSNPKLHEARSPPLVNRHIPSDTAWCGLSLPLLQQGAAPRGFSGEGFRGVSRVQGLRGSRGYGCPYTFFFLGVTQHPKPWGSTARFLLGFGGLGFGGLGLVEMACVPSLDCASTTTSTQNRRNNTHEARPESTPSTP